MRVRQQVRRCAAAAIACLLTVLISASPATAHAALIDTDPADGAVLPRSPRQAVLTFDEAVALPRDGVQVFDATGAPEESSVTSRDHQVTITFPTDLEQGSHVIAWRVISADGHPVAGSLTFAVGPPSAHIATPGQARTADGVAPVVRAGVQAIIYLGLMLVVGVTLFAAVIVPASAGHIRPRRRMTLMVRGAAMVAVVGAVIGLPLTVADQQGLSAGSLLRPGTWVQASAETISSLILLVAGLGIVCAVAGRVPATPRRGGSLAAGVFLAVLAPALSGHSRALDPQIVAIGTDALHVLTGSVWLGGLVGLALTLPAASSQPRMSAVVLTRFSTVAAAALAVLVAAGSVLAWQLVGSWGDLTGTAYGRLLLVKIALVAMAAAVAAGNRFVLLPRTRGAHADRAPQTATTRVGRLAIVEAVVIVAVIVVTGFLVDRSPHDPTRAADGSAGTVVARLSKDVEVHATLEPGRTGQNTVRIMVRDAVGEPVTPSRLPTARLISSDVDLGDLRVRADGVGTYVADVIIPAGGRWELQIGVRLSRFENPVATMAFDVIEAPDNR